MHYEFLKFSAIFDDRQVGCLFSFSLLLCDLMVDAKSIVYVWSRYDVGNMEQYLSDNNQCCIDQQ